MALAREAFIVRRAWSKIRKGSQTQAWGGVCLGAAGDGGEREGVFRRKKQAQGGGGVPTWTGSGQVEGL